MKPSAVLLIDLENYYLSREALIGASYNSKVFEYDLVHLLRFANEFAADRRLIVRRAYANFTVGRKGKDGAPEYYLRKLPETLLNHGVEPVQVFQLSRSRTRSKNAADMRMAMDATALLETNPPIERFVFVTGDADFIPVILELNRHGREVAVIGVKDATNDHLKQFVDQFAYFEDLLPADLAPMIPPPRPVAPRPPATEPATSTSESPTLESIAGALAAMLSATRPIKFASVHPQLTTALGRAFDPKEFGFATTGEFLRKHAAQLGIECRKGGSDWLMDRADKAVVASPTGRPLADWHTTNGYTKLLGAGGPKEGVVGDVKLQPIPWASFRGLCDDVYQLLNVAAEERPAGKLALRDRLLATDGDDPLRGQRVTRFLHMIRRANQATITDTTCELAEGVDSAWRIAENVICHHLLVLSHRLAERNDDGPIRPDLFAAVYIPESETETETLISLATRLLTPLAKASPADSPSPEPSFTVEETPLPAENEDWIPMALSAETDMSLLDGTPPEGLALPIDPVPDPADPTPPPTS